MKVAIVHDFLHQMGGAERVLEVFHEIFPAAPVFTLIYNRQNVPYRGWDIRPAGLLKYLPFKKYYPFYMLLFPRAIENFRLDDYDLVLTNSYGWSKAVKTRGVQICYCLTPLRWAHEMFDEYVRGLPGFLRGPIKTVIGGLARWDTATGSRPDYYLTTCRNVAAKIKKYYGREAEIIYPPVDTDLFKPGPGRGDFFLCASRLVPYKRIDLAVAAFTRLGRPLVIIGTGPEEKKLKKMAGPNIKFLGRVSDADLLNYYQKCLALVFPGEEDFGIVPLEAMACGTPVIAFKKGGVLETILAGRSGIFFDRQTPEALAEAVANFDPGLFNVEEIRNQALNFSRTRFKKSVEEYIKNHVPH